MVVTYKELLLDFAYPSATDSASLPAFRRSDSGVSGITTKTRTRVQITHVFKLLAATYEGIHQWKLINFKQLTAGRWSFWWTVRLITLRGLLFCDLNRIQVWRLGVRRILRELLLKAKISQTVEQAGRTRAVGSDVVGHYLPAKRSFYVHAHTERKCGSRRGRSSKTFCNFALWSSISSCSLLGDSSTAPVTRS